MCQINLKPCFASPDSWLPVSPKSLIFHLQKYFDDINLWYDPRMSRSKLIGTYLWNVKFRAYGLLGFTKFQA